VNLFGTVAPGEGMVEGGVGKGGSQISELWLKANG
jgi:hypothetical protein